MTKEEYRIFKSQYELLGQLEQERKRKSKANKKCKKEFIIFLDTIEKVTKKPYDKNPLFEKKLKKKIEVIETIKQAFDKI